MGNSNSYRKIPFQMWPWTCFNSLSSHFRPIFGPMSGSSLSRVSRAAAPRAPENATSARSRSCSSSWNRGCAMTAACPNAPSSWLRRLKIRLSWRRFHVSADWDLCAERSLDTSYCRNWYSCTKLACFCWRSKILCYFWSFKSRMLPLHLGTMTVRRLRIVDLVPKLPY